jgi:hypothetical protein
MNLDKEVFMGLMNLHDAFLNASLLRSVMRRSPIVNNARLFEVSDRGRFERLWVATLYVLVEAWNSPQMRPIREFIASKVDIEQLNSILRQGAKDGNLRKMEDTGHYMFHRDKRKYWDNGRLSVCGQLEYHESLHMAFSHVLLSVLNEISLEEGQRGQNE